MLSALLAMQSGRTILSGRDAEKVLLEAHSRLLREPLRIRNQSIADNP